MRRSRLVLLGGQTLALGMVEAFLVVPASALFLSVYGARMLPWAYLVVAAAGLVVSALVTRASRTVPLGRLGAGVVAAYLLIVTACWLALLREASWPTFVLVVLFPLSIPVGFVIVGSQAVRLYDVRELKAQFPRAVAGFPAGFALGGLAAGALAGVLGDIAHLLLVGLVCAVGLLALILYTARQFPAELLTRPEPPPADVPAPAPPTGGGLRGSLVLGVLAYQLLSGSVTQLLDYMVWERAAAAFPEPAPLARFQGYYGAGLNIASIVFVFLLASWLLRRYGVRLGLAANPALVVLACLVLVVLGQGPTGIVGFGFLAAACAAQVADITTTDGLTRTSLAATYQALPPDRRLRTQALAEGAGTPLAIGLAGALLLVIQAVDLSVLAVAWLVLAMSLLWLGLALGTYRSYAHRLAEVLRHRAWDPRSLRIDGPAAQAAARRLLGSPDPDERLTGLEALADSGSTALDAELALALHDDDPRVRLLAVDLVGPDDDLARRPAVRDALVDLLEGTQAGVRAAAALAGRQDDAGHRSLELWTRAASGTDHALAEAAVAGAARTPHPSHLPVLLEVAARPGPPLAIVEALAAHADRLGPTLTALWQAPGGSGQEGLRRCVTLAVAGAGSSRARAGLLRQLDEEALTRPDLRLLVDGLRPASWTPRPGTVPARTVRGRIDSEAERVLAALHGLARLQVLQTDPPAGPPAAGATLGLTIARDAFRDELREAQRHVEILFGATASPRGTAWFLRALSGDDPALRASAVELAEAVLGRERGPVVVAALDPTLDEAARAAALERAGVAARAGSGAVADWLGTVALDPTGRWDSPWLAASVLRALPGLAPGVADQVARELAARGPDDPVLAQTVAWAAG